ncbi:hypothetical protein V1477_011458 [Vespula maculifrons]|uniref:Uncharacterized protein n=1 Tax=Vespula maculifrons TaxID=7453 RepID=A0ABD2BZ90_VESMC
MNPYVYGDGRNCLASLGFLTLCSDMTIYVLKKIKNERDTKTAILDLIIELAKLVLSLKSTQRVLSGLRSE